MSATSDKDNEEQFTVKVTGSVTGEQWYGVFKAKKRLSHRDRLNRDKLRRDLLGGDGKGAEVDAVSISEAIAEITIRLTESPKWWSESANGLDLADSNVISEVYQKVLKVEQEAFDLIKKKAEEAEKALKETVKEAE